MLRDILSSRILIFGLIFCVLCVGGALLYSSYLSRKTEEQLAKTDKVIKSYTKATQTAQPDSQNEQPRLENPEQSEEIPLENEGDAATETGVVAIETEENVSAVAVAPDPAVEETPEDAATSEVRVSPFGLGIFPEVPPDYPDQNVWERIERAAHDPEGGKKLELLIRVRIKLWEQGTETIGASYSDQTGLIYPSIPGVVYVEWAYFDEPDGTRSRYASTVRGAGGPAAQEYLDRGEEPPGITVIPYDEAGIDPYTFLEFTHE